MPARRSVCRAGLHHICIGSGKNSVVMKKSILSLLGIVSLTAEQPAEACTRAVYLGPDGMTVTGRTMDWKEDPHTNLYIFPRGIARRGAKTDDTVFWTSKYGSLAAAGYDIGICDGMNEAGLVASLLFLPETVYSLPDDKRPVMGLSIWTQYVLDNFATVDEAVTAMSEDKFRIDSPDLPNGVQSRLHLAVNDYWRQIGGLVMLPGTNRSSDRFVRASFYINAVEQSADPKIAVPTVMSVMRNVSVPYGISTPDAPHIASTRWRVVADQKNRVYFFEPTLSMGTFHVNLADVDFSKGSPERVLILSDGTTYTGDATSAFRPVSHPFDFLFGE